MFGALNSFAQISWNWTQVADMPEKISNNAVTAGEMAGEKYVFSFGGIDTTKIWSGISKRSCRYDVMNDVWDEIDTLPVVLPLIASSASTVKNKIYIIGGYHVYSNGNETSSDEVVIYDPETNTYLSNGSPIPIPIDDQVQCVWKDSLIYVITGWSNTGNVPNVQIYDPALDQWTVGTATPNTSEYKVFGGSGQIIGDTIYYYGGASTGLNFPAQFKLRKGVINPVDPSQITWTTEEDHVTRNYRSACLVHGNNLFWVGGSAISYNYNGIAYNGSGGVSPLYNIARYDAFNQLWNEGTGAPYGVMDLRGNGQISPTEWVICGGMADGQAVSNSTFRLSYDPITGGLGEYNAPTFYISDHQIFFADDVDNVQLFSLDGKLVGTIENGMVKSDLIGVFILSFQQGEKLVRVKVLIK